MGKYTPCVDEFVALEADKYRWRKDCISCTRSRLEYHLNWVGAEIINRSFRNAFLATERKAVFVPGCMRARPEDTCEAKRVTEGLICTACTPECRTNQVRAIGEKHGFEVFTLPYASDLPLWVTKAGMQTKGVVGVACLITLVGSGWELKRYGVPTQCVLWSCVGKVIN